MDYLIIFRMKIWATAISQDLWDYDKEEFPAEMCDAFLTFRLMKLLKYLGMCFFT